MIYGRHVVCVWVTTLVLDIATIVSGMLVIPSAQRMHHHHTGRLLLFTLVTEVCMVVLWQERNFMAPRQSNPESSIRSVTWNSRRRYYRSCNQKYTTIWRSSLACGYQVATYTSISRAWGGSGVRVPSRLQTPFTGVYWLKASGQMQAYNLKIGHDGFLVFLSPCHRTLHTWKQRNRSVSAEAVPCKACSNKA